MVLFSISSVNISKYKSLQLSLQDAFSGRILSGGRSIAESGSDAGKAPTSQATPAIAPIKPVNAQTTRPDNTAKDNQEFLKIKREIDAYARKHGLSNQLETVITRRGLVVRLLTDRVVFDPGQPAGLPLLKKVSQAIQIDNTHPIMVEGHTDNVPISGSQFPSNWELSTARASVVVRFLIDTGIDKFRLGAAGYANLYPVASNSSASGRSKNRRVEIVLLRKDQTITPDIPGNG
jgi:chemotaxis protein MotB